MGSVGPVGCVVWWEGGQWGVHGNVDRVTIVFHLWDVECGCITWVHRCGFVKHMLSGHIGGGRDVGSGVFVINRWRMRTCKEKTLPQVGWRMGPLSLR